MALISCLIPLYRSGPFYGVICENIDAHLSVDSEILVSDRHGLDDTTDRLAVRYANQPRVRIISNIDAADWVSNINGLILAASGKYFRIVPHDDTASGDSTMAMVEALEANEDAVLAYGVVRAIDLNGNPMQHRDELNSAEIAASTSWSLEDALTLMWKNRFLGAFKGVVRSSAVRAHDLLIEKTPTLVLSERVWLFALALTGRFQFVPESVLFKRYHGSSTSSKWIYTPEVLDGAVDLMLSYCEALIPDPVSCEQAKLSVTTNGRAVARVMGTGRARPAYRSLVEILSTGQSG